MHCPAGPQSEESRPALEFTDVLSQVFGKPVLIGPIALGYRLLPFTKGQLRILGLVHTVVGLQPV